METKIPQTPSRDNTKYPPVAQSLVGKSRRDMTRADINCGYSRYQADKNAPGYRVQDSTISATRSGFNMNTNMDINTYPPISRHTGDISKRVEIYNRPITIQTKRHMKSELINVHTPKKSKSLKTYSNARPKIRSVQSDMRNVINA